MNTLQIRSKGTLATTEVFYNEKQIPTENLANVTFAFSPEVAQPQVNVFFVGTPEIGDDGQMNRLQGVNPEDVLEVQFDAMSQGQRFRVAADADGHTLAVDDTLVASKELGGGFALNILADGFAIEFGRFERLVAATPLSVKPVAEG